MEATIHKRDLSPHVSVPVESILELQSGNREVLVKPLRIMAKRHRLFVGVDYGTTYSGFAYANSKDRSVNIITTWPGNAAGYDQKVPSRIAYHNENKNLEKDAWGYEVPTGAKAYSWTKLLLDKDAVATKHDDPDLKDLPTWAEISLPEDKTAEDVVTEYLKHLYQHCMKYLEAEMTKDLLNVTPIDFWFTIPALWSDAAQHTTRRAARRAGFGKSNKRKLDSISMIKEPEAAALVSLKASVEKFDDLLKVDTGILICDCGGGTVDLTAYTIAQIEPSLRLEESCVGDGGKCGSTFVDRNFMKLMADRYGKHYTSLPAKNREAGSYLMKAFEDARNNFDGSSHRKTTMQLIMKKLESGDPRCFQYDPDENLITVTPADLRQCYKPVMEKLIELIEGQTAAVKREGKPAIKNLILVGGFGSSPYVWKVVKEWCEKNDILPISPDRPWSAIARGAALRGLEGVLVTRKRYRRHYGTSESRLFDTRNDPRDKDVIEDPVTGQEYRRGWMKWQISKGMEFTPGEKKSINFRINLRKGSTKFELQIWSCSLDEAPARYNDPDAPVEKVAVVQVRFSEADFSTMKPNKAKKGGFFEPEESYYDIGLTCEAVVADASGVLEFVVTYEGQPCGTTKLDFQAG